MNQAEWNAIIELLNRVPLTQAERLWLQIIIEREIETLQQAGKNEI